jgi:hypothetical protein
MLRYNLKWILLEKENAEGPITNFFNAAAGVHEFGREAGGLTDQLTRNPRLKHISSALEKKIKNHANSYGTEQDKKDIFGQIAYAEKEAGYYKDNADWAVGLEIARQQTHAIHHRRQWDALEKLKKANLPYASVIKKLRKLTHDWNDANFNADKPTRKPYTDFYTQEEVNDGMDMQHGPLGYYHTYAHNNWNEYEDLKRQYPHNPMHNEGNINRDGWVNPGGLDWGWLGSSLDPDNPDHYRDLVRNFDAPPGKKPATDEDWLAIFKAGDHKR